jgi:hypothetical protein
MRTAAQADNTAEGVAEEEEASEAGEVGHGRSNSAANFDHGPCYRTVLSAHQRGSPAVPTSVSLTTTVIHEPMSRVALTASERNCSHVE